MSYLGGVQTSKTPKMANNYGIVIFTFVRSSSQNNLQIIVENHQ